MGISLKCLVCLLVIYCLQCHGDNASKIRKLRANDKNADIPLMETHFPLKDGNSVYFWRLQKVGSSTMLSILMSYAYRYNFLPRRKSGSNAQCRKIAQCALDNAVKNNLNRTASLESYVKQKVPGSGKIVGLASTTSANIEALGNKIPYKISLGHELCNLNYRHIEDNLVCSFSNPEWPEQFKQGSDVKELFMVRDPISRAISIYYFWGELFKLSKASKEANSAQRARQNEAHEASIRENAAADASAEDEANDAPPAPVRGGRKSKPSPARNQEVEEEVEEEEKPRQKQQQRGDRKNKKSDDNSASDVKSSETVITVKGKLSETKKSSSRSNSRFSFFSSRKKDDIKRAGRLLGEEDAEVLEEVDRLLSDEEGDYYNQYLDMIMEDMDSIDDVTSSEVEAIPSTHGGSVVTPFRRLEGASDVPSHKPKLGLNTARNGSVDGKMFVYHGDESTVPPIELAMSYAASLPYFAGMPGPSLTWSAFANKLRDALNIIQTDRMLTVVVERLDESLVVAAHYLGWSLADMVVTVHRKALSSHPKSSQWPKVAIDSIKYQFENNGEYQLYNASVAKLNERVAKLKKDGIDVNAEVKVLKSLQKRVTSICLDDTYLQNYRDDLKSRGYPAHPSENKLRDVEEKYSENGHIFSFNREILCSFDVCGSCEAHALLHNIGKGGMSEGKSVEQAATLASIDVKSIKDNVNFAKCPKAFPYPVPTAVSST